MVYYICARHAQCGKPCNENCLYSHDFFKSKLYLNDPKPIKPVDFIKDKYGNWVEINWDWDKNLPDSLRAKPEEIIHVPYPYLMQIETARKLKKDKKISDKGIIF